MTWVVAHSWVCYAAFNWSGNTSSKQMIVLDISNICRGLVWAWVQLHKHIKCHAPGWTTQHFEFWDVSSFNSWVVLLDFEMRFMFLLCIQSFQYNIVSLCFLVFRCLQSVFVISICNLELSSFVFLFYLPSQSCLFISCPCTKFPS